MQTSVAKQETSKNLSARGSKQVPKKFFFFAVKDAQKNPSKKSVAAAIVKRINAPPTNLIALHKPQKV